MKKIFWLVALATMCFASCSKDEVVTPSMIEPSEDFTATLSMSRTHLEGTSVLWDAADQLTIFTKTAHNRQYKVKSGADTKTAVFSYVGYTGTNNAAINGSYAIYPYDAEAELAGNIIKTKWQAEQIYNASAVNLAYAPMVAYAATGTDLAFKNAGALLRFNLSVAANLPDTYTLQSIKVASAANNLAGTITIDPTADSKAVVTADGVKEVTLSGINAVIDATVQSFYVALPATVFAADDLKVTFAFAEGARTVTLPAFTLNQGSIKTIVHQITADEFTGSTEEFGEVADLSELPATTPEEQAVVAQKLVEALSNPEVGEIKLPAAVSVPMTEPIKFGAPASRAEVEVVMKGRNVTIDGNGSTLEYKGASGENTRIIDVTKETNGMNLTLKNLTIENKAGGYVERGVNYNTNGKLTLEHVKIKCAASGSMTYAINLPSSSANATVEITNSDICGLKALNLWGENTQVTITDSELESVDYSAAENYSAIALNDNGTTAATGSKITVTGGKIIAKDENGVASTAVQNECIAAEVNISDETEVVGEKLNAVAVILYANTDNHYSCFTLQDAIDQAAKTAGCTLKLIRDITLTKAVTIPASANFTLDLNGKKISQTKEQTAAYSMIQNNGKLTIIDSSESKSGVITYTDSGNGGEYVSNTISNSGTLTIESGTIINNSSATVAQNGYPHAIDNNAGLIINGGTITSANYSTIRIWCTTDDDTAVTINGGVFTGAVDLQNGNANANKGTLTIKSGKFNYNSFTSAYEGTAANAVVRLVNFGEAIENLAIDIEGGQFEGGFALRGSNRTIDFTKVLHISGGTFKVDPSAYVVEDYRAKLIDGVWQIVNAYELQDEADLFWLANEVNVNGKTYEGKTFKLMNDVTLTQDWEPIGSYLEENRNTLKAAFDGNQKTIKGMTVNGAEYVGFFGAKVKGDVTNLYIDGATISGTHYAGGIVGWMHNVAEVGHNAVLNVKGCKVTNSNITLDTDATPDNGDKAGGIVGFVYLGTIDGCSVANTNIKAYRDCGGIVGIASTYQNGSTNYYPNVSNNTVGANVKLTVDNDQNYKNYTVQEDYDFDHIIGEAGQNTVAEGNSGTVTIEWGTIPAN